MSTIIPSTLMTEDQAKLLEKINKQEDLFSSKKKGNAFFGNRVWQSAKVRSHATCAATEFGRAPGAAKASAECSFPRKQTTEEEPAAMSEAGRSNPGRREPARLRGGKRRIVWSGRPATCAATTKGFAYAWCVPYCSSCPIIDCAVKGKGVRWGSGQQL
jgi:hypothetical protein